MKEIHRYICIAILLPFCPVLCSTEERWKSITKVEGYEGLYFLIVVLHIFKNFFFYNYEEKHKAPEKESMEPRLCQGHPSTVQGLSRGRPTAVDALAPPILERREKTTKEGQGTHSSLNCKEIRGPRSAKSASL